MSRRRTPTPGDGVPRKRTYPDGHALKLHGEPIIQSTNHTENTQKTHTHTQPKARLQSTLRCCSTLLTILRCFWHDHPRQSRPPPPRTGMHARHPHRLPRERPRSRKQAPGTVSRRCCNQPPPSAGPDARSCMRSYMQSALRQRGRRSGGRRGSPAHSGLYQGTAADTRGEPPPRTGRRAPIIRTPVEYMPCGTASGARYHSGHAHHWGIPA